MDVIDNELSGLKILYLDDDTTQLSLVTAQLESLGATVVTADRAKDALEILAAKRPPDLILCDILMPDEDGHSFHRAVRANAVWRALPFVYATALGDDLSYRHSMNMGADGYIAKPFTIRQLHQELGIVLARHREIKEVQRIEIVMLNGQSVRRGNELLVAPDRGVEQLVLYLILQGRGGERRMLPRAAIVRDIWGEMTSSGFRSVLSRARRWSEEWLEWHVDAAMLGVSLRRHVTCDLYVLDAMLAADVNPNLIEKLYRGTLLPAYGDDWVAAPREELAERVKAAFLGGASALPAGRERAANLRRAISVDPYDLSLWEEYIRNLVSAGLPHEAEQARREFERLA